MILDDILAHKRDEVAAREQVMSRAALQDRPLYREPRRGFRAAIAAHPAPAVIAELKRASPSKGVIRTSYDPVAHARAYEIGSARARACEIGSARARACEARGVRLRRGGLGRQ